MWDVLETLFNSITFFDHLFLNLLGSVLEPVRKKRNNSLKGGGASSIHRASTQQKSTSPKIKEILTNAPFTSKLKRALQLFCWTWFFFS